VRELVNAELHVDQLEWMRLMSACQSTLPHDRLYGLWGVPMNAKVLKSFAQKYADISASACTVLSWYSSHICPYAL
jgi:hypothetical protein